MSTGLKYFFSFLSLSESQEINISIFSNELEKGVTQDYVRQGYPEILHLTDTGTEFICLTNNRKISAHLHKIYFKSDLGSLNSVFLCFFLCDRLVKPEDSSEFFNFSTAKRLQSQLAKLRPTRKRKFKRFYNV